MNKMRKVLGIVIAAALVTATLGVGFVAAQDQDDATESEPTILLGNRSLRDRIIEELDLDPAEIRQFLEGALIELAEENGIDVEALQAEVQAEQLAQIEERLSNAVENGFLTQEEADEILSAIESGELPQGLLGLLGAGRGFRGFEGSQSFRSFRGFVGPQGFRSFRGFEGTRDLRGFAGPQGRGPFGRSSKPPVTEDEATEPTEEAPADSSDTSDSDV